MSYTRCNLNNDYDAYACRHYDWNAQISANGRIKGYDNAYYYAEETKGIIQDNFLLLVILSQCIKQKPY